MTENNHRSVFSGKKVMDMWKKLYVPGAKGSEGGIVYADEEYNEGCRITLEKCPRYYAITCGVYGAMVHTVFRGLEDYQETYGAMKKELEDFMNRETTEDEEIDFYDYFTNKYV